MRVPLCDRRQPLALNLTPMIDVVFQLIIFFLLSTHFVQQEAQQELALPTAATGHEAPAESPPRVTINLLPDGQILMGSSEAQPNEIASRLAYERERTSRDLEVRIRADRSLPYGAVEPVLLACAEAGIWNVTFAVYKKEP
jgi:biopolymer transport protein ExbD